MQSLGETVQLVATVQDQNGQMMSGATVTWASGDPLVATVDASGLVTAVANGTASVTGTAGSASGSATVTVDQVLAAVVVEPANDTLLAFGDTLRLSAEAVDANGHAVAGAKFAWASEDELVATVDARGLVTAVGSGSATVRATAGTVAGTATVTVDQVPVGVVVEPDSVAFDAIGDTARVAATFVDANTYEIAAPEVEWASADASVATVDASGLVTAVGNGTATVTVEAGSVSGTSAVTVEQAIATVSVTPATAELRRLRETVQLTAEVRDRRGRTIASATVEWRTEDQRIATVDSTGLVTARSSGSTTITATAGSASGSATVLVADLRRVTVASVPTNGGTSLGSGRWFVFPGQAATTTLAAEANAGYDFDRWTTENGRTLSTDPVHVMDVLDDHAVKARFSVNQERGKWTPGGTYTWYEFPPGNYGVDSISWTFLPVTDPPPSLRNKGLLHYYAMNFGVTNSVNGFGRGYAGLQSNAYMHGRQWGKAINFSIWRSNGGRTDGQLEQDNFECFCYRIMYEFPWVEGRAYRFVLKQGPSGTDSDGKWWGLWVTDLTTDRQTFVGEQRVPTTIQGRPSRTLSPRGIHVFGEDLYWWRALPGTEPYVCSDFDPSSLAILDVRAGSREPTGVTNITNSGNTFKYPNGYVTVGCHVTITEGGNGNVQHNLGFWPEPPVNVTGGSFPRRE